MTFDLQTYLPFLLNRAARRIVEGFSAELQPHGLSLREWRVLATLLHTPNIRLEDLAAAVAIDPSTLSRLVGRLVRQGLVQRAEDPRDRRALALTLSEQGHAVTTALVPKALAWEARMVAGIAEADLVHLRTLLQRLDANLGG
ncbi:MAG: MarR family transcriptional regulator [Alphaproteobacteria bacterium]|nr:MarR family transcriptional regulator [Alphaproteobacteria bacterium]